MLTVEMGGGFVMSLDLIKLRLISQQWILKISH